jgi:recombinational DNA repair protein RecR
MSNLTSQLASLAIVTTGVGVAMSRLGIRHGMLEARRERHRCASCGRVLHARVCSKCTRP